MGWYPQRYASGDIQTTTMTLHIANKAGGGTLGTKIFFNVRYSTSEGEKNCHIATKAEETLATKNLSCEKGLMYNSCRTYKQYIAARLYRILQYCTSLYKKRGEVNCKCEDIEQDHEWNIVEGFARTV